MAERVWMPGSLFCAAPVAPPQTHLHPGCVIAS